jgi:hypothetical protein
MKVNINCREEMEEWIKDYGVYVLYQRTSNFIKCTCVDPLYKAPNPRCTKCNGSGKLIRTEKTKVLMQELYPISRKGQYTQSQVGEVYGPQINFYFVHDKPPKVKDIVYVIGWRNGKPEDLINVYEISGYEGQRGENGRIEFYNITANSKPEMMYRAEQYIDRLRRRR